MTLCKQWNLKEIEYTTVSTTVAKETRTATSSSSAYAPIVLKIAEMAENLRFCRHHFSLSTGRVVESLPPRKNSDIMVKP